MSKIAQGSITNPVLPSSLGENPDPVSYLQELFPRIVTLILIIGSLVFFFYLIIGAIQWTSSGGDKQAVESARGKITNALLGMVILFAVFAIIKILEGFFNTKILTLDIGSLLI